MMLATELSTKKPKRGGWVAKSLIFFLSLAIFMEAAGRLLLSTNAIFHWPVQRLLGADNSSHRLQWIGQQRYRHGWIQRDFDVYHPTRGWTLKPDIKDLLVFDGKILNSNSKGFRGATEYEYERTPGKHRIVVLGDSLTFGSEVSDGDTYSHDLESALPNTEVLNLGVQGYGHDQMLLYLKEQGIKYHPDVVILGFVYLDAYRNLWSFFAFAKPKFKLASDKLELTNVPVPTPDRVLAEEPYRLRTLDLMVILREKLRWRSGKNETEAENITRSILDEIIATTRSIGAVPVFVYLPDHKEISDSHDTLTGGEQYLYGYCQDRAIPCLSLLPRFRKESKSGTELIEPGTHWNPHAHLVAAQEIKDFLLKNNLNVSGGSSP
jgi:hypothetical protein